MKNVEISKWLERLPMAPEFHPTDTEFADPIAYISKIEKEASAFGICKVIPPLPKPSRKYVLHNLNKSLSKCPELDLDVNLVTPSKTDSGARNNCDRTVNAGERRAVFTTRHQQLGCEKGKKVKGAVGDQVPGVQKQVWQSGEVYTLDQFEAKAKIFAKSQLGIVKEVNPLVIETMFWKAASEKPVYVEYANDVPGSGFSEPEGLLRYFDRRRRRRRKRNSFDRNNVGNSDSKNDQVDSINSTSNNNDADIKISPSSCTETTLNSFPSHQSHHNASFSGIKDSQESSEMEGTAGWKLSNSPWNLQVIARSPGSLTRFMPDDIPGVTSPMVYIGMLFSWFAWHVEDHELHSLNFLHMGSPKTWYSVPGDYAFQFEEAIRCHAYGGNSDRLVALSLLGEKTTVLSPEIIVASGIPCCRLVQYPGEFVVTFPRAYHIGFSHGFNCGEAANFGTSKWLTIAKEAAVRRAAMNYLPMLSHQQLLHLLTMSFISRIPRSLLPGVRSSRLRDRLKEERELSVKRAFIEDILHENSRVSVLLQRDSSFRAVLWDVDSLPSSNKESELCKDGDASVLTSVGEDTPKNDVNLHDVDQLSNYISAGCFDFDDDLAYDFQMESGTLPCVACGILGFPFMAVVQPSETASINLMNLDNMVEGSTKDATDKAKVNRKDLSHGNRASLGGEKSQSTHSSMEQSLIPDCSASLNHQAVSSTVDFAEGWKISDASLKPRIFCLEHAIEIEELLRSRGGSNILVICHSDFQKIKTHAAVIAEEIAVPFRYTELTLGNASVEDLNLIDIAIDREDHATSAEDWTSLLNINLQHCMKVKRSSPSLNVEHLLSLGGLFSDASPVPNTSSVKWLARKFRSKRLLKRLLQNKPSDPNEIVKDDQMAKKDVKLIQYSRKRYKDCSSSGIRALVETNDLVIHGISGTNPEDPGKKDIIENNVKTVSAPSALPSDGNSEHVENSFESPPVNPVIDSSLIENVEAPTSIRAEKDEVVGSCSDETLRGEETENEADVARIGCDLSAENDSAIKEASRSDDSSNCSDDEQTETLSDQSNSEDDCAIKEASRKDDSSNCSDDDEQTETLSDQSNGEDDCAIKEASRNDDSSNCSDDDEQTETLSDQSNGEDDCAIKEASRKDDSSNCSDDDEQTETLSDQSNGEDDCAIKEASRNDDSSNCSDDDEQTETLSDQSNGEDDCAIKEASRNDDSSNCSDDDEQTETLSDQSNGEDDCAIKEASRNDDSSNCSDDDEQTETLSDQSNGEDDCAIKEASRNDDSSNCSDDDEQTETLSDQSNSEESKSSSSEGEQRIQTDGDDNDDEGRTVVSQENKVSDDYSTIEQSKSTTKTGNRRKREVSLQPEDQFHFSGFIRGPCEGLRPRSRQVSSRPTIEDKIPDEDEPTVKKSRKAADKPVPRKNKKENQKGRYKCEIEGCTMNFRTKAELQLHEGNRCPVQGCRKKFNSHKYALLHQRVHDDDRPLKCPWDGCTMSFKWAWARTEHVRVHTGERPYMCKVKGCGLTFRFVSDFSRHRRKTGHYVSPPAK